MFKALKRILKLSPVPLSKNHLYDKQTKRIIGQLQNGSNCIDVGCYKGEIMDLILQASPSGLHFGIEPLPNQFEELTKKYKQQQNCTILNFAASKEVGESSFNHVVSNPSYSGLRKRDYDKPNEKDTSIKVKTELLDNLIPVDVKIDLIKIDVEGAELFVLEGASRIINKNKPIVIFEHGLGASDHYGASPDKVFDYFDTKGMQISNLGSFLRKQKPLAKAAFEKQYYNKVHYYFVAHPKK